MNIVTNPSTVARTVSPLAALASRTISAAQAIHQAATPASPLP
jgi:hypothetical protein